MRRVSIHILGGYTSGPTGYRGDTGYRGSPGGPYITVNSNTSLSEAFVYIGIDTSSSDVTVTLPSISTVPLGIIYFRKLVAANRAYINVSGGSDRIYDPNITSISLKLSNSTLSLINDSIYLWTDY